MKPVYHICTKNDPWSDDKSDYGIHPDAMEVGDQETGWPHGDIVTYECPHCGVRWKQELPQ